MKTYLPSVQLMGCHIVELHYVRPLYQNMKHIDSSQGACLILRDYMSPYRIDVQEFFLVILLTNANRVLCIAQVASGSARSVEMSNRQIIQLALLANASAIILAHNHPSGTLNPSQSDISCTRKIQKASLLLDITLLDHLIITSESYFSFSDQQLL